MKRLALGVGFVVLTGCGVDSAPPIAHWRLDERQGTVFADATGRGHDARSATRADDRAPAAGGLYLDGEPDRILRVAGSDALRATADGITVSAWTWRDEGNNVAVVAHAYPALFFGFHGFQFKWELKLDSGRKATCYADEKYRARLGQWYHIAATWDGWVARLFVDGEEICNDWTRGGSIALREAPFTIGGYLSKTGEIIDVPVGRIADVRVYGGALTLEAIRELEAQRPVGAAP